MSRVINCSDWDEPGRITLKIGDAIVSVRHVKLTQRQDEFGWEPAGGSYVKKVPHGRIYLDLEVELERNQKELLADRLIDSSMIEFPHWGEHQEARLAVWRTLRYGVDRPTDVNRTLVKLGEEFGELCQAVLRGETAHAREEAADMALVLTNVVKALGGSLREEMEKKTDVLFDRLIHGKK